MPVADIRDILYKSIYYPLGEKGHGPFDREKNKPKLKDDVIGLLKGLQFGERVEDKSSPVVMKRHGVAIWFILAILDITTDDTDQLLNFLSKVRVEEDVIEPNKRLQALYKIAGIKTRKA